MSHTTKAARLAEQQTPVDVVVVNWNTGDRLAACISGVLENPIGVVRSVVVVDNASSDGSADRLATDPRLEILFNATNEGFGRACNRGAQCGKSPLILFLNPDAWVTAGTIPGAAAWLGDAENQSYAVCGVLLRNETGSVTRTSTRTPRPLDFFVAATGLSTVFPRLLRTHFMTEWDHLDSRDVDHVIGAFYLIRRSVFEAVGGFDERFFLYLEDLDLSVRVREAGHKIRYLAEVEAKHEGGGSSKQAKAARLFHSTRSRLVYTQKHFSRPALFWVGVATFACEPTARLFRALIQFDRKSAVETVQGFLRLADWMVQWIRTGRTR